MDSFQAHYFFPFFRLLISSDPHFKKPELTYNLTDTKYELRMEKLEAGKIYYVGVSLVDDGKYVSSRAGPIPLESPIPPKDMIGKYSKVQLIFAFHGVQAFKFIYLCSLIQDNPLVTCYFSKSKARSLQLQFLLPT